MQTAEDHHSSNSRNERFSKVGLFLVVILGLIAIFLLGVPWLTAYLFSFPDIPEGLKMALSRLSLYWCKLSQVEALHDLMVNYMSFCSETVNSETIHDIVITSDGGFQFRGP